jgi:hypothetical protein
MRSSMEDKKVIKLMEGNKRDIMDVHTGVLQWSPVSPCIYVMTLSELFLDVETKAEDGEWVGITVVNAIAWAVDDDEVGECTQKLERFTEEAQQWARSNACQFDLEKTEEILFTQNRSNKKQKMKANILVGNYMVQFNKQATRWLGE